MKFARGCGVLLHPTSLPGSYGIGDLGPAAVAFLDFLSASGQSFWQMLPLNPTDSDRSPYQCYSAFAGNPLLVSPDALITMKFLRADALSALPKLRADRMNFGQAHRYKMKLFRQAWKQTSADAKYDAFCESEKHWLENYALFMALRLRCQGAPWTAWDRALARFEAKAVRAARHELASEIRFQKFVQYLFFGQLSSLKEAARTRGIKLIGDIPIFVGHNSADVWSNQKLFALGRRGEPAVVAGVPPDFFSKTGQRWGNPLYRWEVMQLDQFDWWLDRFDLTGMKVLHFAFSSPANEHLPHNFLNPNCVVYTGTHDNDTTRGWWAGASRKERQFARRYLQQKKERSLSWELIQLAHQSTARLAIIPMQDLLDLPTKARMNTPGTVKGNWLWRCPVGALTSRLQRKLHGVAACYGRIPIKSGKPKPAPIHRFG